MMNTIPTVDLAAYLSGEPARMQQFAQDLGKAYQEVGFVAVRNHGVDAGLVQQFYDAVQRFFAMPEEGEMQI